MKNRFSLLSTAEMSNPIALRSILAFLLLWLPLGSSEKQTEVEGGLKRGMEAFNRKCSSCHGTGGEGKRELKAPAIAGLPLWYTQLQIESFKKGFRGGDEKDLFGAMMRNGILNLSDSELSSALLYASQLQPNKIKETLGGNVSRGKKSFKQHCAECHRYDASGEKVFKSAPLVMLEGWYLKEQLRKFTEGLRGQHPKDQRGQKMVEALGAPLEELVYEDLIAYIGSQRKLSK